jgi:hypothetical protein
LKAYLILGVPLIFSSFLWAQTPVRMDDGTQNPNEISLCIDRANPANLIAGSNINQIYISGDTGKTWSQYDAKSVHGVYGDPVLVSSKSGKIYYAHLAKNPEKKWPEWFDKIVVQYSTDAGKTFSNGAAIGFHPTKMQDKPWLNLDEWPTSPFKDRVYVSWTEFDRYKSPDPNHHSNVKIAWSDDGGDRFSNAVKVSDISGGCLDDDNSTEGATTASLPDGTLCMVWSAFGKIWFDKSKDGGKTWGKDQVIAQQIEGWEMDIQEIYRANGFPFIVCDKSQGQNRGRLYVFFGDKRLGDADEWLMWSDNQGTTWTEPMRLNTDAESNGRDQFMGHFTIDQTSGQWYALYYDQRYGFGPKELNLTLAWGNDTSVYNYRLTPQNFHAPGKSKFFGDYISIDAHNNTVVSSWTAHFEALQLFSSTLSAAQLKPHSSDKKEIKFNYADKLLIIQYQSGIRGEVIIKGKRLWIFPIKKTIHFDHPKEKKDELIIKINSRIFRSIYLDLSQPESSIREQSGVIIPKK